MIRKESLSIVTSIEQTRIFDTFLVTTLSLYTPKYNEIERLNFIVEEKKK